MRILRPRFRYQRSFLIANTVHTDLSAGYRFNKYFRCTLPVPARSYRSLLQARSTSEHEGTSDY